MTPSPQDLAEWMQDAADAESSGRLDKALSICDRILAQSIRHNDAWKMRTRLLMTLDRLDDAFSAASEAARLFPDLSAHRLTQARVLVRRRDWPAAGAAYRAILKDHPLSLNSMRELMDFEPIPLDDPVTQTLLAHRDSRDLKPYDRASVWFLLGQVHMNAGQDDAAFVHFDEGNRQMRAIHSGQRMEYGFSRLLPEFDAAFQARNAAVPPPDPCPLMVVAGLPRSGKSLIERLLAAQAMLLAGGETGRIHKLFLNIDRTQGADAAMQALKRRPVSPLRRYFQRRIALSPRPGASRMIDTTPGNLEQLAFLGPLHPDVPVVFVRRDPLDLATALFFKQFNSAHRYSYDLATAARAIARTEYLMQRWRETLPNPMTTIHYEEMVTDPVGTTARVLQAVGLAADVDALRRAVEDDGRKMNLTPGRSLDGIGAVRRDLVGFSARFAGHLGPVLPAYRAEVAALA